MPFAGRTSNQGFLRSFLTAIMLGVALPGSADAPPPSGTVGNEPKTPQDGLAQAKVLREKLGAEFIVEYSEPFLIAGNIPRGEFIRIRDGTISGAYRALSSDFFRKKLDFAITIYLLKDAETYRAFCRKKWGEEPTTPFGSYRPSDRSLVMDISTGTGTLVHEMVHPLMEVDFPGTPTWFNEGLASLFEQCSYRDGSLRGLPNWRLPGLQKAIEQKRSVPLSQLVTKSRADFHGADGGLLYAESRYLCMYLQERSLLVQFYTKFRDAHPVDPRGLGTLETVIGKPIGQVEPVWLSWVSTLKYIP